MRFVDDYVVLRSSNYKGIWPIESSRYYIFL